MPVQGIKGRHDSAGEVVVPTQDPVGERQELAAGGAAQRGEQQGAANEENRGVAGEPQRPHDPTQEIDRQWQRETEHKG